MAGGGASPCANRRLTCNPTTSNAPAAHSPTAIFASNDEMAAGVLHAARARGLDVPGDLSIIGFDDTSIADNIWPPLTTVHQPIAAMARAAVDLVLEEIRRHRDGGGEPRQLMHPHTLIVRDSSGPASV